MIGKQADSCSCLSNILITNSFWDLFDWTACFLLTLNLYYILHEMFINSAVLYVLQYHFRFGFSNCKTTIALILPEYLSCYRKKEDAMIRITTTKYTLVDTSGVMNTISSNDKRTKTSSIYVNTVLLVFLLSISTC